MAELQPILEILVVEDTEKHRESAQSQFKDHKLTLAKNYEEAKRILTEPRYYPDLKTVAEEITEEAEARKFAEPEMLNKYRQALKAAAAMPSLCYHVLLTDLMMPKGGRETMGPEGMKYIFDLLPFGFPLAFLAAKRKVPYVGIVTDVNHHDHPISAAIDSISGAYWHEPDSESPFYRVNESKLGIFHAPFTEDGRKDWNKVLEALRK